MRNWGNKLQAKYLSNKFGLDSPHFFYDILYIIYFGVKFSVAFNLFLSLLVSHSMNKQMGRSQLTLLSQSPEKVNGDQLKFIYFVTKI